MIVQDIHAKVTDLYTQIEDLTKENPIAGIIYSIAIKCFSIMACSFSGSLGVSLFLLSLSFDFALLTNLKNISKKIENYFFNLFESSSSEERTARNLGIACKESITHAIDATKGFFKGLFPDV
ncbi:MAG: hypothetical protein ACD_7C00194G0002 [uncultured bacterium]|nr:MAG: hypothetical protein ACD_7C00194G0002 [uncultured bacterium]